MTKKAFRVSAVNYKINIAVKSIIVYAENIDIAKAMGTTKILSRFGIDTNKVDLVTVEEI